MLIAKYKGFSPDKDKLAKKICKSYQGECVGAEYDGGFRHLIFRFSHTSLEGGASYKLSNMGYLVEEK